MRFPELTEFPFHLEKTSGIARVFENFCTCMKLSEIIFLSGLLKSFGVGSKNILNGKW